MEARERTQFCGQEHVPVTCHTRAVLLLRMRTDLLTTTDVYTRGGVCVGCVPIPLILAPQTD